MRRMEDAPKDGTRVLMYAMYHLYDAHSHDWRPSRPRVIEGWYHNNRWQEWHGSEHHLSTAVPEPIGWWPLDELTDMEPDGKVRPDVAWPYAKDGSVPF